jgi:acetylornithine/succinyldiaminopimelate/putrescine aminotransferase
VAAVILEPIQSMAGVKTAEAAYFQALRQACDGAGALLIFDEVQTGMGRLGTPFAGQFYGVQADLMTLAKGLASGVPMGALVVTEAVAARLSSGDLGSTFGGSPLACAALQATVGVIQAEGLMANATAQAARLRAALAEGLGPVTAVPGEGLLLGLRVPGQAAALKAFLQTRQILVGASGDVEVLRLMPPLVLEPASMEALIAALREFPKES